MMSAEPVMMGAPIVEAVPAAEHQLNAIPGTPPPAAAPQVPAASTPIDSDILVPPPRQPESPGPAAALAADAPAAAPVAVAPPAADAMPPPAADAPADPAAKVTKPERPKAAAGIKTPVKNPKYGAAVPVGGGKFIPVGSGADSIPMAQKIDFETEKAKIEEEFTKLEEQLDSGALTKEQVEKEFEVVSQKAETLRRLQEAEQAAAMAEVVPRQQPAQLAPVRVATREPGSTTPSMAVVHWKGVTKQQFTEYRTNLLEKYGSGPDKIKTMQKIPNRILITAPIPAVMEQILADETLEPRPEPYQLPSAKKPLPVKPLASRAVLGAATGAPLAPLAAPATLAPIGASPAALAPIGAPPAALAPLAAPASLAPLASAPAPAPLAAAE